MNLENLETKLNIKYYNNLIKYCKKTNNNYTVFKKKLTELKDSQLSITETEVNDCENIKEISKNPELNDNNSNIQSSDVQEIQYSEDYLYKKPWTKLTSVHKMIKMKEFVNKLLINNEDDKNDLKKKLVGLIKTKKLTKKNMVKYDSINGRVIAVPILKYKNGKYLVKNM